MEQAIQNQIRGQQPEDVTELVLDTCKASKVSGLEKFTNLRTLTLNGCGLTTLEGFPQLPQLQRLELSDNNLSDGLDALQDGGLINLKSLSLAGNKFSTLDSLEPLGSLPSLRDLDLFNCAVTQSEDYRSGVFELLPSLKYLDGFDIEDNEKEEDDEEDDGDLDDEDDENDDLLDSEVGEEEDDGLLGEEDTESVDEGASASYDEGDESDQLGEEDGEEGEEGEEEYGEEGEEEYGEEGEEEDEGGDEDDGASAKRQKR